ncbi:YgaP family membrane protein [Natronomonas sp.]|jgi:hypothetical protein|uniref:YgaP family membrane protein n=1 Tax=Natronomonas sp. TaxID=2184060 RepID=UPI002FC395C4
METNIGSTDRIVRLVAGVILAGLGLANFAGVVELGYTVALIAIIVGAVLVGTAMTRMCLIYRIAGVDTCQTR